MTAALITGGAGAVGSNLADYLLKHKHTVVILDDLSSGHKANLANLSLEFVEGSILDNDLLESIFKKHKISHVFHLAALFANQNSVEHPGKDLEINGAGTLNVLEMALKYKVEKLVYTSSSCVYGNMVEMVEDKPLSGHLDTPYAITKLLGEQYCKFYGSFHGLPTVCARLFNAYGPGEQPGPYRNVIPNFFSKAIKKESLVITGTGLETRDFTFVGDIAQGLYKLGFQPTESGDIFNLGSGTPVPIKQLVDAINVLTENDAPVIYEPRRGWDHVMHRVANISKAKTHLGYQPSYSLAQGLALTHEWLCCYA